MKTNKATGSKLFPALLIFAGMAGILTSVGMVLPVENGAVPTIEISKASPKASPAALPPHPTPAGDAGTLSSAIATTWEVEVLGRDILDGENVVVLEFYPADLNQWRTHPGGKAYWSIGEKSVVALRDRVSFSGHVRERFLRRTDSTEKTFHGLPLEALEQGL